MTEEHVPRRRLLEFDMIVAADEADGIGKDGGLPWKLPGDTAFFKRLTTDSLSERPNAVIMGRRTWESIPPRFRPLAGRKNAVVTRNAGYAVPEGVIRAADLDDALALLGEEQDRIERVFVIGGGEVYRLGMASARCRRVYLTRVHARYPCDAYFPAMASGFRLLEQSERHEHEGVGYTFEVYERSAEQPGPCPHSC